MFSPKRSILLAAILLVPLTACGTGSLGAALQQALSADPNANRWSQAGPQVALPQNFPPELQYPNATLQTVEPSPAQATEPTADVNPVPEQTTRWLSPDPKPQVQTFYRNLFQTPGWTLLEQAENGDESTLVAQRGDLQVTVSIPNQPAPAAPPASPPASNRPAPGAEFVLRYVRGAVAAAPQPAPVSSPTLLATTPQQFSDLSQAPKGLQPYLEDLAQLGVLTSSGSSQTQSTTDFQPNQPVSRAEFARWLVEANNRIYRDQPGRQIRLGSETSQPTFQDVRGTDPAFPFVQGLAEAGFIPSSLAGTANAASFRPNAPLTREDLLLWKVPVDLRRILPTSTVEAVRQTWGFQDANRIAATALRAVSADHQNGDLANIRRVLGSTLLFQPKKPVTRAEAAAALWYIGTQGEGLSAREVLEAERQGTASPTPTPTNPENSASN